MPPEEARAIRMVTDPETYNREMNQTQSPEERDQQTLSRFAITNPAAHAQRYPETKDAARLDAEAEARSAITNPVAHWERIRQLKTPDQLKEEELDARAITHPDEFIRTVIPGESLEGVGQSKQAVIEALHPGIEPTPIYKAVPVPEVLKNLYKRKIRNRK